MKSFPELGLIDPIAAAFLSLGCAEPTPIQEIAIPALIAGRDISMESETGTGKTFAYLAPALQICSEIKGKSPPLVLIAAPTQELAVQIGREAEKLAAAANLPLRTALILGGTPLSRQAGLLHGGPSLIIGTLGRLADHVAIGSIKTHALRLLILDEADRLLAPETEEAALALLKKVPFSCVRALVSATLPKRALDKAAPFLREALHVAVEAARPVLAGDIEHWCFYCDGRKRLDFMRRFEAAVEPSRCLVFLSTAARVESVAERLAAMGLPISSMQAKMDKEDRRVALERFAEGKLRYLVTSDLGARGLDIQGISHVVSLDLPEEQTIYIHRAGRTGRAGAKGVSIILADGVELKRASRLAVKEGFVFRCKFLESGKVYEPQPEDFFARVEEAEAEKADHRRRRAAADTEPRDARQSRPGQPQRQSADGRQYVSDNPNSHNRISRNPVSNNSISRNADSHNAISRNYPRRPGRASRDGEGPGKPDRPPRGERKPGA